MSNYEIKINAINIRDVQIALRDWCSALHVMPDLDPDEVLDSLGVEVVREWLERKMTALGYKVNIKEMIDEIVEVKAPKRERKARMTKEDAKAMLSEESLDDAQNTDSEWP